MSWYDPSSWKGVGGKLGRVQAGILTGGLSEVVPGAVSAAKGIKNWYDAPYDEKRNAYNKAGDAYTQLGKDESAFYMGGMDKALGNFSAADAAAGKLTGPSNSQSLYDEAKGGGGPASWYNRQRTAGEAAINQQAAARGAYNSSGALIGLGNYDAASRAEESRNLAGMASSADSANTSGFNALASYGGAKAGIMQQFYKDAGQAKNMADVSAIDARLAAHGVSAEERNATVKIATDAAKAYAQSQGAKIG